MANQRIARHEGIHVYHEVWPRSRDHCLHFSGRDQSRSVRSVPELVRGVNGSSRTQPDIDMAACRGCRWTCLGFRGSDSNPFGRIVFPGVSATPGCAMTRKSLDSPQERTVFCSPGKIGRDRPAKTKSGSEGRLIESRAESAGVIPSCRESPERRIHQRSRWESS